MPRPRSVIDDTYLWVSGNVVIHPTASIAPDVLLQADPDCQLIVAAGACIGSGSILHAHDGKLTIESGATLGSGVLVVGHGTIGAEACIGSMSTIIDSSIESNQSVPPGSLIGDSSRQVDLTTVSTFVPPVSTFKPPSPPAPPVSTFVPPVSPPTNFAVAPQAVASQTPVSPIAPEPVVSTFVPPSPPSVSNFSPPLNSSNTASSPNGAAPPAPSASNLSTSPTKKAITQIYGQAYLERIMITMFPHRQHVLEPLPDPPDDPTPPAAQ